MSVFAPKSFAPVRTWLPPWALGNCVRAVLVRNAVGFGLSTEQGRAHYPASPICAINCLLQGSASLVDAGTASPEDPPRMPLAALTVSGPQTQPRTVFYETSAHGVMVILYADAWWALTGIPVTALADQIVEARSVLPAGLMKACERLFEADDDTTRIHRFFDDLLPLWQQRPRDTGAGHWQNTDWSQSMTPWIEAIALRAAGTGWGRSLRQTERRIKQWTGWSLRTLQGSVRGEAAFFGVMEAMLDDRLDWSQIALDHGFSDQSHFIRETRRITGFSPEALRHGLLNDEAFWSYRAWAGLAGYKPAG